MKGQITVDGALEQCKTALSLDPDNINAHIYTGYFQCLNGDMNEAEREFLLAISNSGKIRQDPVFSCLKCCIQKLSHVVLRSRM